MSIREKTSNAINVKQPGKQNRLNVISFNLDAEVRTCQRNRGASDD